MLMTVLEWAVKVVIAAFILLLLSLLLWFIWGVVMRLFHGPELDFFNIALLAFLAAIAAGSWGITFLRERTVTT